MKYTQKSRYRNHIVFKNEWCCGGCGKDCLADPKDYYMLQHDLWLKINGKVKGMLCMDCVETRLGRNLQKEDILPCELTIIDNPYTTNFYTEDEILDQLVESANYV